MKGFLRALALVILAVLALVVLRLVRAEADPPPVLTQRDLHLVQGVPVETALVEERVVQRRVRAFGTARGLHQAEVVVPSPNVLERLQVQVGQEVRAGQTLATMRAVAMSPLGYPYEPLRAKHEAAQADLARYEALFEQEAISGQQLDHARAQARAAQADWEAARTAVQVPSPISGVVTRIDFRQGEVVPNDRPLAQVAVLDPVEVDLMVEPGDVALVYEGLPVELRSSALPGQVLQGEVVERALAAHPRLGQFRVEVQAPNPEHLLLPGFPVEATLVLGEAEPGLAIPASALTEREGVTGVWVVREGRAHWVLVQVGLSDGGHALVSGELGAGEAVVTLGAGDLREEGQQVLAVD